MERTLFSKVFAVTVGVCEGGMSIVSILQLVIINAIPEREWAEVLSRVHQQGNSRAIFLVDNFQFFSMFHFAFGAVWLFTACSIWLGKSWALHVARALLFFSMILLTAYTAAMAGMLTVGYHTFFVAAVSISALIGNLLLFWCMKNLRNFPEKTQNPSTKT
jgi:hypothetical protein